MKTLSLCLMTLSLTLIFLLNNQLRENRGLKTESDGVESAIEYHETKNAELGNRIQFLESKIDEYEAKFSEEKTLVFELKTENNLLKQQVQELKNGNRAQALALEQKNSEILVLKNELLKYFQEAKVQP